MKRVDYADREMAVMKLADEMAAALRAQLAIEDRVSIAVPGGTTPGPIFDALSAVDLDWARVTILLTDERYVPEDSSRSNAGLIRARFLQGNAASARFIPFFKPDADAVTAAANLSDVLEDDLPLSLVVLGMGEDMHTASLFPGADGLVSALAPDAPIVLPISTDSQPEPRLTLSARVLNGALHKHVLIFGDAKRAAFENALGRDPIEAPIMAVVQGGTVHWAP